MRNLHTFTSRRVLVDTSAYFALSDRTESRFPDAQAVHGRLVAERWRLFTTNFIVAETHALLLTRLGYSYALRFLNQLDQSPTVVVRVAVRDEQQARTILHQYTDKAFSLTDATSFAIMERLKIPSVFTFDHHFAHYGFSLLTATHS
ncbi:MAG: type II toxin-antitoxin system VapC family toxin [Chloroflexi bacterium]|nr:type II toxin-antitoxin system VapC family toxin [Chloroflexota bacterium]